MWLIMASWCLVSSQNAVEKKKLSLPPRPPILLKKKISKKCCNFLDTNRKVTEFQPCLV